MNLDAPSLRETFLSSIRERGPLTVAEAMDLALYHPEHGYYSTAGRRSGRSGDFYTSVDVGPLFGALVAAQIADMWSVLRERGATSFHLVEAGASDGRLARDVLTPDRRLAGAVRPAARHARRAQRGRARATREALGEHGERVP